MSFRSKNTLIHKIFRPFRIIPMHRATFIVWAILTLLGGLVGVIANVFKSVGFGDSGFLEAVNYETITGSLYTYSIAIIASVLGSLFVLFEEKDKLNYRYLQIPTAAVSIIVLLFGGIFYAFNKGYEPDGFDWKQVGILFLSVFISIYVFCLSRLDDHDPYFNDISDKRYTKNDVVNIPSDLTNEGIAGKTNSNEEEER